MSASSVKSKYFILLCAVVVYLVSQLPFLTDVRPVMCDEAWYAESAYNLSQGNGLYNTIVGSGGNANFVLPCLTAFSFRIFGYSLFSIRIIPVLCGLITLILLSLIISELSDNLRVRWIVLGLFVSILFLNSIFRFGRPECASLMFSTLGVLMFIKYRKSLLWIHLVWLSLACVLATCSHPYAILLFALMGIDLLFVEIKERQWKKLPYLLFLIIGAIVSLFLIVYVNMRFNGSADADTSFASIAKRATGTAFLNAYIANFRFVFIKHGLYMLPLLIGICYSAIKSKVSIVRELSVISLAFLVLFPLFFSADINMIGCSADYLCILGLVVSSEWIATLLDIKYKKWTMALLITYVSMNLCVCCGYNYYKYEETNSILTRDFKYILPRNAKVAGPIKLWPMAIGTQYISDHYRLTLPDYFDYYITADGDVESKAANELFKDYYNNREDFEIVYQRNSKQYGLVTIYKCQ